MRIAPAQHRAYTYKVTVPPVNLAVSLATFKKHIKQTSTAEDALLTLYLEAAIGYAEKITRRDFITRTYETYRDFFPLPSQNEGYYPLGAIPSFGNRINTTFGNVGFEIRKSPLASVVSIQYFVSNVLTTVDPATYYNTVETDYSDILTLDTTEWPEDADVRQQTVVITFTTGFGPNEGDVPSDIRGAIVAHATAMWANRGDCDDSGCSSTVPAASKMIYMQNRIENL